MQISNERAIALCNELVDSVDGTAAGYTKFFAGAAMPAETTTADAGTLILQVTFQNPAWAGAADANPGGQAAISGTPSGTGEAGAGSGTVPTYVRVYNGDSNAVRWQSDRIGTSWSTKSVTSVDTGANTLTSTAHGLTNGQPVTVSSSGGSIPIPLKDATVYYVVGADTNTVQLAATQGGSAIDITGAGSGTITLVNAAEVQLSDLTIEASQTYTISSWAVKVPEA